MSYSHVYKSLSIFGKELLEKKTISEGLPLISKYAKDVIGAQRCSIFIYDNDKKIFWTTIADGVEKITIPSDKGLVGYTLKARKPIIANDAYSHPQFLSDVDKKTGYKTHNIITAPIFNSKRQIIGVLQLLNKEEDFNDEDVKFMIFFAHYISGFLELSNIFLTQQNNKG
jgi:signal transduction protein with GAF and PtsI domain